MAQGRRVLAEPARRPVRPLPFLVHSVLGLCTSLFLAFVCLTGTIATVSHEIEWLLYPQVRATMTDRPESWGGMWDAVRTHYPDAEIRSIISYDRNDEPYFVRTARVELPSGEQVEVYVDPGSGSVTGQSSGETLHSFMRALHYHLMLPGALPFYFVCAMGLLLLVSVATGLITYKKFWRGFLRRPRWHRGLRTLMGDLHRLIGLWSMWFALIIGLTCFWYIIEHAGLDLERPVPVLARTRAAVRSHVTGTDIDRWIRSAQRRMPGLRVTAVIPAADAREPVVIQGQWRAWLVRERANAVFIDPATNRIVGARDAGAMPPGERIVHTADPLHFGNFGGLASKILWASFGLLLTGLSVSGLVIFVKRTKYAARQIRVNLIDGI